MNARLTAKTVTVVGVLVERRAREFDDRFVRCRIVRHGRRTRIVRTLGWRTEWIVRTVQRLVGRNERGNVPSEGNFEIGWAVLRPVRAWELLEEIEDLGRRVRRRRLCRDHRTEWLFKPGDRLSRRTTGGVLEELGIRVARIGANVHAFGYRFAYDDRSLDAIRRAAERCVPVDDAALAHPINDVTELIADVHLRSCGNLHAARIINRRSADRDRRNRV